MKWNSYVFFDGALGGAHLNFFEICDGGAEEKLEIELKQVFVNDSIFYWDREILITIVMLKISYIFKGTIGKLFLTKELIINSSKSKSFHVTYGY